MRYGVHVYTSDTSLYFRYIGIFQVCTCIYFKYIEMFQVCMYMYMYTYMEIVSNPIPSVHMISSICRLREEHPHQSTIGNCHLDPNQAAVNLTSCVRRRMVPVGCTFLKLHPQPSCLAASPRRNRPSTRGSFSPFTSVPVRKRANHLTPPMRPPRRHPTRLIATASSGINMKSGPRHGEADDEANAWHVLPAVGSLRAWWKSPAGYERSCFRLETTSPVNHVLNLQPVGMTWSQGIPKQVGKESSHSPGEVCVSFFPE